MCSTLGDKNQSISSLKNRADFLRLNKSGKKWIAKNLIIQADEGTGEGRLRYGITVTKKTYKSAVKRNRIKRRLRALANDILKNKAIKNKDYVLIGRPSTLDAPYQTLEKDLIWCLKRMECHA
ncbi:MAG: ribonuclease P protein component [Alphaproteobacteria bacterium]|nr:ribonuclease P protein component [Alphaproteobacteria bacterium]HCQ70879.1 ribonuclease P protein component [Rhodospirillaceae bacterium]|tara:strand:- start:29134 stop:29502 length:369 start_codon:yes stop_codon:yes gene_type:complete